VTLIPYFIYIPTADGVSNAEIGVLVVMHAIAGALITLGLTIVRTPTGNSRPRTT
jgi:hypothetical protein